MKKRRLFRKIALTHIQAAFMAAALAGALFLFVSTRYLARSADAELLRAARLAETLVRRDLGNAALISSLLSESVSPAASPDILSATLRRELKSTDADFISIAGPDGVVIAHAQSPRRGAPIAEPHIGEPLFLSRVFRRSAQKGESASGVEPIYPNTIAVVAVSPIRSRDNRVAGFLRFGYRLDDRFARNIKSHANLEVAVTIRGAVIASTLNLNGDFVDLDSLRRDFFIISRPLGDNGARLIIASPRSRIARVQRQESILILAVMAVAFAAASLISLRLTTGFTRPLGHLLSGIQRIEDGDLNHALPILSDDEIGRLAESFNRMTRALQRRDEDIRRHQDQLIQSGKLAAIGELAAGVAHEIGNPLAAVSGYVQLLAAQNPDPQTNHYLEAIEKEVGFIDAVIRELLDFARPSQTEHEEVSLNDTVDEALRILSFHKTSSALQIHRVPSPRNPRVSGSRRELLQATLNLAINAVQAMPDGGTLQIQVASHGEHPDALPGSVALIVADTGSGIPPDNIPRIFDPFFTTKPGGSGLGLAITFRIVERHNADIQVRHRDTGGTVFTILFPLLNSTRGATSS